MCFFLISTKQNYNLITYSNCCIWCIIIGHVAVLTDLMATLAETKPKLKTSIVVIFIANEENSDFRGLYLRAVYNNSIDIFKRLMLYAVCLTVYVIDHFSLYSLFPPSTSVNVWNRNRYWPVGSRGIYGQTAAWTSLLDRFGRHQSLHRHVPPYLTAAVCSYFILWYHR